MPCVSLHLVYQRPTIGQLAHQFFENTRNVDLHNLKATTARSCQTISDLTTQRPPQRRSWLILKSNRSAFGRVGLERPARFLAGRVLRTNRSSNLHPKASAYLVSVASEGECLPLPDSIRATADCVVPIFSATCAWVKPCAARAFRNSSKWENSSASFSYSAFTSALASALVRSCLCVNIFPLLHSLARKCQFFGRCLVGFFHKLVEYDDLATKSSFKARALLVRVTV